MLVCGVCGGKGKVNRPHRIATRREDCKRCGGDGLLPDPELQHLAVATEKIAEELKAIRLLAERAERARRDPPHKYIYG